MSGEIAITCSNCSKTLNVVPSDVERIIKCSHCRTYLKIPARKSKRIEMSCPSCSTILNVPLKLRGSVCSCWSCNADVAIPSPAQFVVKEVSVPQTIEQGGDNNQIDMVMENSGMPAEITGINVAFESNGEDLNPFFNILSVDGSSSVVDQEEPVTIACTFEVAENAPAGKVNIHIKITGEDSSDGREMAIETTVETSVGYKRIFAVQTENELEEIAGQPFAVQLWACLENGDVDSAFNGTYTMHFSVEGVLDEWESPKIPQFIEMEFFEGVATTGQDFILYNASETPQILVSEQENGIGDGCTDFIQISPTSFYDFTTELTSPQMSGCLFHGENKIYAIDNYGNVVSDFEQDIVLTSEKEGEIRISGQKNTQISGSSFQRGQLDLTALKLSYFANPKNALPYNESFIIESNGKTSNSSEIVIDNNPLEIFLEKVEAPNSTEQGKVFSSQIQIFNSSSMDIKIAKIGINFYQNGKQVNKFFDISISEACTRELKAASRSVLEFEITTHEQAPEGEYTIETYIEAHDTTSIFRNEKKHSYNILIEPTGRMFKIQSLSGLRIIAGNNISLKLSCLFNNEIDLNYNGKKKLFFESNASQSANSSNPFIPSFVEIVFENGVGQVLDQFSFTNAQETPTLSVTDHAPGGASGKISFEVIADTTANFWFVLEAVQTNMTNFTGKNFVMAMDAYGNLDASFAENCEIFPATAKGHVVIGDEIGVIPAEGFQNGVADLTELQVSYHSDVTEKLPKEGQFQVAYGDIVGKSESITIQPKPAEIHINRVTSPEKIDRNSTYQVSIEIENKGNKPANVSTILFNFQNDGDVSSHYITTPTKNNSETLLPFVPFLATFEVKTGNETPSGLTSIDVTVAGVDQQEKIPLRSSSTVQWIVEEKERAFVVTTQNDQEIAGVPFFIKFEVFKEDVQDKKFNETITFNCSSNVTKSKNSKNFQVPESISVSFVDGEAITDTIFSLTNVQEEATIYFRTSDGKIHTSTSKIELKPSTLNQLDFRIAPNIRAGEVFVSENTICAVDAYGNIIEDFQENISIALDGIKGNIYNVDNVAISSVDGNHFEKGILNLTNLQIKIECAVEEILPRKAKLKCSCANQTFMSNDFQLLARPINLHIDEIASPSQVVWGNSCLIEVKVRNDGQEAKLLKSDFNFSNNGEPETTYTVSAHPQNIEILPKGITSLQYYINIPESASQGTTEAKVHLTCQSVSSSKETVCQRSFRWFVEASGKTFSIAIPDGVKAGKPFSLIIEIKRDKERDFSYEGEKDLLFKSNARPAPNGVDIDIPSELSIEFKEGIGKTPEVFHLFNANEQIVIEVEEKQGSTSGLSGTINVQPAPLGSFHFDFATPQVNENPFYGECKITAKDAYENIKYDFEEDVQIRPQSGKGDFYLADLDLLNTIPKSGFKNGIANLTSLGIIYKGNTSDPLPKRDTFFVSFQDKQGQSNEVVIEPRPNHLELQHIEFTEKVFQGDLLCPISFKVGNCSDQELEIQKIEFTFINEEDDVSFQFGSSPHPNNPKVLLRGNTSEFKYHIDIDSIANVGNIELRIKIDTVDSKEEIVVTEEKIAFSLVEKPRTFIIKTEHDNVEKVGQLFYLVLCAYKDNQLDVSYNDTRKIYFSSTANNIGNNSPRIPESEEVTFKQGIAKTGRSFMFVKAQEKPTITAIEQGKAEGKSEDIELQAGSIQSLQILFQRDQQKVPCVLKPLDNYGNMLSQQYAFDEDIKPGCIISGSSGNFYEIVDLIGHGAMGKVYRAKRLNDNQIVAIKSTIFNALSDINRFILEAVMLIQFDHVNIVKGYDIRQICSIDKGKPQLKFYLVMEFLTGQTVKDIIDTSRDGILSPLHATKIILDTGKALKYIWDRKTIHRDIKPENIQITKDDKVKLLDLGIARAEGGMTDISITRDDTIVGSYPYISPERLKSSSIDYRADIYSLGSTYYHMLTGMPPYLDSYKGRGGKDLLDYLIKIRTRRMPTPPDKLEPRIPASVSNVIMTMLSIKANRRFRDSEEMISVLEKLYKEIESGK